MKKILLGFLSLLVSQCFAVGVLYSPPSVTPSSTATFTNKTYDTAGTGNIFKINGVTISANTGTGSNVLATSPTLVTPNIGDSTGLRLHLSGNSGFSSITGNGDVYYTDSTLYGATIAGQGSSYDYTVWGSASGGTRILSIPTGTNRLLVVTQTDNTRDALQVTGTADFKLATDQHIRFELDNSTATVAAVSDAGTLTDLQFNALNNIYFSINSSIGMIYSDAGLNTAIMRFNTGLQLGAKVIAAGVTPTVSGFGTGASVTNSNGTAAFTINVGTGGSASTGTVTFSSVSPTPTGWVCNAQDVTTPASFVTSQTGGTASTATFTNYSRTTGLAIAWTASDVLRVHCTGY